MSTTINHSPTILLTNDDGPPGDSSPFIWGLFCHLRQHGFDVVIPSSQKSWIGKAYHIQEVTHGRFYYPRMPDGQGEISEESRPLKDGEIAEWILLDATPATCTNISLHNLYPSQIDLVLSGPNYGRNSSAAFTLSSGTIGAAMSSALSKVRSIAISYGLVMHPTPTTFYEPAHKLALSLINELWTNWGADEGGLKRGEVDLYNINVPLIAKLLDEEPLEVYWTSIWRNSYHRLFKAIPGSSTQSIILPDGDVPRSTAPKNNLHFKWSPQMEGLVSPDINTLPAGSDAWAIHKGYVSVTPLRASFSEPEIDTLGKIEERKWKL